MKQVQHGEKNLDGGFLAIDVAQIANPTLINAGVDGGGLIPLILSTIEDVVVEGNLEVDSLHGVLIGEPVVAVKPVGPARAEMVGRTGVGTAAPVEAPWTEESIELNRGDVAAELTSKDNGT